MSIDTLSDDLIRFLRSRGQPLFALLDAARSPAIVPLLAESGEPHECLYSGKAAAELAHYAPYLLRLSSDSRMLEKIVTQGWGDAWGYFLVSDASFDQVRTHLRKFLTVTLEEGEDVYFRFYDPRVIRVFLPTCTPEQACEFLKPISFLLCPAKEPTEVLAFRVYSGRLVSRQASISMLGAASLAG